MIYLDNAATSWPKPESVYLAVDDFLRTKAGNPGRGSHSMAASATRVVDETRTLAARLFNVPESNRIIFTTNCTDSLNMGLKGILKPGDHVIVDSISHNSIMRPLNKLEKQGIKITRVFPSADTGAALPADIESAITPATRMILITHASNVNGVIQPIGEYGKIAQRHDLIYMVDAAQTAGVYPVDVQSSLIDLLACSGHKGLFGPPGTGILFISDRVNLDTQREGGTGSYSEKEEQPLILPDRYESGTLNSVGIAGLGAGLKFVFAEGLETIRRHEMVLIERLIEGLSKNERIKLYLVNNRQQHTPVLTLRVKGYPSAEIGKILDETFDIKIRAGLHCAPSAHKRIGTHPLGSVRLSPGYFNTNDEIDAVIHAFKNIPVRVAPLDPVTGKEEDC